MRPVRQGLAHPAAPRKRLVTAPSAAAGAPSRAPHAGTPASSLPGTAKAGRAARSAPTPTRATRSWSSAVSSPASIPAPAGTPSPGPSAGPLPGRPTRGSWPGHWKGSRRCWPATRTSPRCGRSRDSSRCSATPASPASSARHAGTAAARSGSTSRWTASGPAGGATRGPAPSRADAAELFAIPSPGTARAGRSARTA